MAARSQTWLVGAVAVAALASVFVSVSGCGGDPTDLALSVGVAAQFQAPAGPPRAVGYQIAVVIEQVAGGPNGCPKLPANLHLLVDGTEVPATLDPSSGCLQTSWTSPLSPQVGTVTVDALVGGGSIGHAEFSGLAPGAAATLAVPADGVVQAGDEVVVVPPPDLATAYAGSADVYALDDTTVGWSTLPNRLADRQPDGIHVVVPAFSGRGAITFTGMPYVPLPSYSCPGFDFCTADADNTVGPVFVTESP